MVHVAPNEFGSLLYRAGIQNPTSTLPANTYTFATLPSAAANKGMLAIISDGAAAPVFSAAAAGGGSLSTAVYSDGTTWRNG
ncbi:MAG: hypothetical protein C5B60_01565 [Chloroflexi bacterium]|nr:MAG: hypothetical protein C5B60_01565 [Chloroflexota bacterium]